MPDSWTIELRGLLRLARGAAARRRWILLAGVACMIAGTLWLLRWDHRWLAIVRSNLNEPTQRLTKTFSRWGDYPRGTLLTVSALWAASRFFRWRRGRRRRRKTKR